MKAILNKYLTKPIMMLIWEPILLLVTIYISFIYGILCTSLHAWLGSLTQLTG
jgi:MFS transporter, DHA1 family, multidrug resistance protein